DVARVTTRRAPTATLFPYTTLFRSEGGGESAEQREERHEEARPRERVAKHVFQRAEPDDRQSRVGGAHCRTDAVGEQRRVAVRRSEEHTSELQSRENLVCRLLLEKK